LELVYIILGQVKKLKISFLQGFLNASRERRENFLTYFECFFTKKLFVYIRKNSLPGNNQNLWASKREIMSDDKEYEAKEKFPPSSNTPNVCYFNVIF
jgi:hypothetical protein